MNREMLRFRESFRGYNRDDVNSYIEQLNLVFSRREADYKATIAELEAKSVVPETPSIYTHTDAEWDDINSRLVKAQAEIEELNRMLADARKELETNGEAEKQKMFDSMSSQVGNIIISANNNADKIISEAKETADKLKADADAYAMSARFDADVKKAELIGAAERASKEYSDKCIAEFSEAAGEAVKRLAEVSDGIKARVNSLTYSFELKKKEIEKKLNENILSETEG